jgi:hypothetical protein
MECSVSRSNKALIRKTLLRKALLRKSMAATAVLLIAATAQAQTNYIASEIPAAEWPNRIVLADMDGDGRKDVIIPHWTPETGRQLLIHLQQDNGRFSSQVSRIVDIRPEIVAVALADVRAEPGEELLLFTGTQVFSLSSAIASYSGNLRPLFEWPMIAAVPDKRVTLFLSPATDLTGNGHVDLLLPGAGGYGWFSGGPDEQFTLSHQFSTTNDELDPSDMPESSGRFSTQIEFNERDGLIVKINARSGSAFEDFLADTRDRNDIDQQNTLLSTSNWMPPAIVASMNAARASDIVYLNIGNDFQGQLNILPHLGEGRFNDQPAWQGPVEMRGDFHLLDLNGNGLTDIMRMVANGSDWDVYFYTNQGGRFNFAQPAQVMRFSGYDVRVDTTDILQNGRPQLSVSYYTIPVVNAIRNTSIVRTQLLYGSNNVRDGQLFNARPDFRLDENFSAASVRGLSSPIYLEADLNGNGRVDALYLTPEGTLAAKTIDDNLRFANAPFWQYVPGRTIVGFDVEDLNGDGVPDIILYHSNTTTILVSAP